MHLKGQKLRLAKIRINIVSPLGNTLGVALWPGLVLSTICLYLKMTDFQIGLVNAIPNIVLPGQIFAAFLLKKWQARKKSWFVYVYISKLCIFLLSLLLFIYEPAMGESAILSFMIIFFMMHLAISMSIPLWFSWIGDIVPERDMASFWGNRNVIVNISGLFFSLCIGYALDWQNSVPSILAYIIFIAFILSTLEVIIGYQKLPAQEFNKSDDFKLSALIHNAWANQNFRSFLTYAMLVSFGSFLIIPFFFIHFKDLGLSSLMIQVMMGSLSVGAIVGSFFWSSLASFIPNKQVLMICIFFKIFVIMGYMFLGTETNYTFYFLQFTIDGFINGGIMTASLSILTAETPKDNRETFTALYFSLVGFTGFLGSTLSGYFMETMGPVHYVYMNVEWMPFHLLILGFVFCHILSLLALSFYSSVLSGSTWNSMLMFFEGNPFLSVLRLTKLKGYENHNFRLQFIRRNRSKIFLSEIIEAVDDPSPSIRQAALYSISLFNDKRSEDKLLEVYREKVLGLEHMAIEGLGRLKSTRASSMLIESLSSNDLMVRKAAAWSLGRIKDRSSLIALKQRIAEEDNPAVAADLADALSQFGDLSTVPYIFPYFKKIKNTCLRRQFGVSLANILGKVGEFYPMLIKEKNTPGVSRSKLIKELQKRGAIGAWLDGLQDAFDEDEFSKVIRVCFRKAFSRYYPNLDLEAMVEKDVMNWSNEDFEKAVGGMDSLIKQTGAVDYTLWLLTIMNVQYEEQSEPDLEDALLSLYILSKIY